MLKLVAMYKDNKDNIFALLNEENKTITFYNEKEIEYLIGVEKIDGISYINNKLEANIVQVNDISFDTHDDMNNLYLDSWYTLKGRICTNTVKYYMSYDGKYKIDYYVHFYDSYKSINITLLYLPMSEASDLSILELQNGIEKISKLVSRPFLDAKNFFLGMTFLKKINLLDLSTLLLDKVEIIDEIFSHLLVDTLVFPTVDFSKIKSMQTVLGEYVDIKLVDFTKCLNDIDKDKLVDNTNNFKLWKRNESVNSIILVNKNQKNLKQLFLEANRALVDRGSMERKELVKLQARKSLLKTNETSIITVY